MNNKIFCTTYNYNNKVENITFKSPYYTFYQYFSLETCILPFIIFYIRNKQNPPTRHQIHSTPSDPSPEILSSLQNSNGQPRQRPRPLYGKFSVALQKFQSPRCNRRTPVQKKGTTSNENVLYVYTYMCVCVYAVHHIFRRVLRAKLLLLLLLGASGGSGQLTTPRIIPAVIRVLPWRRRRRRRWIRDSDIYRMVEGYRGEYRDGWGEDFFGWWRFGFLYWKGMVFNWGSFMWLRFGDGYRVWKYLSIMSWWGS